MVILVTGATGGLGQSLCHALRERVLDVRAGGRDPLIGEDLRSIGCDFVVGDLAEGVPETLTRDVRTVFHLAALSRPWGPRRDFEAINVDATRALINQAKANGCAHFVYASTPSIFSSNQDRLDLAEDAPVSQPFANHYARTKYEAEQAVLAANSEAFKTTVLRPRAITGPNDTVILPRLLRAADKGFMPLPRSGKALIELTDVRDVTAAFLATMDTPEAAAGQAFNISGGQPVPLKQLLELVFAKVGRKVRYLPLSAGELAMIAGAMEAVCKRLPWRPEPLLTHYTANTLSYSQTLDISKARTLLGWVPQHNLQSMIDYALTKEAA